MSELTDADTALILRALDCLDDEYLYDDVEHSDDHRRVAALRERFAAEAEPEPDPLEELMTDILTGRNMTAADAAELVRKWVRDRPDACENYVKTRRGIGTEGVWRPRPWLRVDVGAEGEIVGFAYPTHRTQAEAEAIILSEARAPEFEWLDDD